MVLGDEDSTSSSGGGGPPLRITWSTVRVGEELGDVDTMDEEDGEDGDEVEMSVDVGGWGPAGLVDGAGA